MLLYYAQIPNPSTHSSPRPNTTCPNNFIF